MDTSAGAWGSHCLATVRGTEFAVSRYASPMTEREPVLLLPSDAHIAHLPWVAELLDENRRITVEHAAITRLRRVDAYCWYADEGPFGVEFFDRDRDLIREPRSPRVRRGGSRIWRRAGVGCASRSPARTQGGPLARPCGRARAHSCDHGLPPGVRRTRCHAVAYPHRLREGAEAGVGRGPVTGPREARHTPRVDAVRDGRTECVVS